MPLATPQEVRIYETTDGRMPFSEWMDSIAASPIYGVILTRLKSTGGPSMPSRSFREWRAKELQDPERVAQYLTAALEDSPEAFLIALRHYAQSHNMTALARSANVNRESLYRMLSGTGNPRFSSLTGVLRAIGMHIQIVSSANPWSASSSDLFLTAGEKTIYLDDETIRVNGDKEPQFV